MSQRALILGNYRPSYVLARALVKRGYQVVCGLDGYDRGAEMSCYVDIVWDHPPLDASGRNFQEALNTLCDADSSIKIIFPITENFVKAFADEKLTVPNGLTLGSMPNDTVRLCLDKQKLLTKAHELNVPVAPFAITHKDEELATQASAIGFPLVVRPLSSTTRLAGKKAATCHSLTELMTRYEEWKASNPSLLIQKQVSGKRDNIYFAAHDGEIYRYLHAKIERTDQPDGSGLALEGITVNPSADLEKHVRELVKALHYSGIGCAQFLVDPTRDEAFFLEINPRIAGNHALPDFAGLELSDCLIDLATGKIGDEVMRYGATDIRYTWLAGECEAIRMNWHAGKLSFPAMINALFGAIRAWRNADFDIALNKTDWKPGIISLCDSLPAIGRVTRKRLDAGLIQSIFLRKKVV